MLDGGACAAGLAFGVASAAAAGEHAASMNTRAVLTRRARGGVRLEADCEITLGSNDYAQVPIVVSWSAAGSTRYLGNRWP